MAAINTYTYLLLLYRFSVTSHWLNLILHVYTQVIHWQRLSTDWKWLYLFDPTEGCFHTLVPEGKSRALYEVYFFGAKTMEKVQKPCNLKCWNSVVVHTFFTIKYLFFLTLHAEGYREKYRKQLLAIFLVALYYLCHFLACLNMFHKYVNPYPANVENRVSS
jgi:hypothetical protein